MKRNRPHFSICFIAVSLVFVACTLGFAAEKTPFYQGKTLTFVVNFAAGGPTDIESRVFAKHLRKHIPGQPAIVVQNMGGGGGITGVNYIGEVAKPDGLTAGLFHGKSFPPPDQGSRRCAWISENSDLSRAYTVSPFPISERIRRRV